LNYIKHLQPPFSCCPQMWIKHIVEDTYYWGPVCPSPLSVDDTRLVRGVIANFFPAL
jgi:hypothetical protein